jgi:hypothetical protein
MIAIPYMYKILVTRDTYAATANIKTTNDFTSNTILTYFIYL